MHIKFFHGALVALGLLATTAVTPALAQSGVRVGTLTCDGAGTTSMILSSTSTMICTFLPQVTRRPDRYRATMQRFGFDVGVTTQSVLAWVVFSANQRIGQGDIAGTYSGVTGGAVIGVGVNANVLIGGSNNAFALQPLSFQAATGLNVSAGVAGLTLQPLRPVWKKKARRARR